ncbi:hypothetical protein JCM10213_003187 [Rhodosporidiobolus nylandii]
MASPAPPLANLLHSTGSLSHAHTNRSSTALLTPALASLADPPSANHRVDQQLVQFLTHEVIHALLASVKAARERREREQREVEEELAALGLSAGGGKAGGGKGKGKEPRQNGDEERKLQDKDDEEVRRRIGEMGFKVGWSSAERLAKDRPLFPPSPPSASAPNSPPTPDPLELIKFLCRDLWLSLYAKQVDNLRTNHRGTWVLLDGDWRPLRGLARGAPGDSEEGKGVERWISFLLAFPCGILRGALANLGMPHVSVTGESAGGVQATFQIKINPPPGTPVTPTLPQGQGQAGR